MEFKVEKSLKKFLKKEKVWEEFKRNVLIQKSETRPSEISSIATHFTWHKTPEGQDVWIELNHKFCKSKEKERIRKLVKKRKQGSVLTRVFAKYDPETGRRMGTVKVGKTKDNNLIIEQSFFSMNPVTKYEGIVVKKWKGVYYINRGMLLTELSAKFVQECLNALI